MGISWCSVFQRSCCVAQQKFTNSFEECTASIFRV
jgi:hypothetical protein